MLHPNSAPNERIWGIQNRAPGQEQALVKTLVEPEWIPGLEQTLCHAQVLEPTLCNAQGLRWTLERMLGVVMDLCVSANLDIISMLLTLFSWNGEYLP